MADFNRLPVLGIRALLLAVLLFTVSFFVVRLDNGLVVNTDLKDLSPRLTHDKQIQQAIDRLSSSIESRFILLLASPDRDSMEEAHDALVERLTDIAQVAVAGNDIDNLAGELAPHRFRLLSEEQRFILENATDEDIIAAATDNLYQLSSAVRLLPLHQDPFGWLGEYLLNSLDNAAGSDSIDDVTELKSDNGTITYYKPVVAKINRGALELDTQQNLLVLLNQAELELKQEFPGLEVFHSGVFFFASNAATESKRDIGLIGIGSMVGIVILLLFAFSSLWPLVLPFLSIAIGVSFAFATIYTLFGSVHIITVVFGASLIGIVIDYSLHYFYHQADTGKNSHGELHRALLFSLITSVIGYSALSFSSLPSLRQVALFSCVGLIAAWLSVVALAPLVVRRPVKTNRVLLPKLVSSFNGQVCRVAPFSLYLFIALFIAGSVLIAMGPLTSDDPRAIFSAPQNLISEDRIVSDITNDFEPGKYLVISGDRTQEIFNRLVQLNQKAGKTNGIPALVTIDQWIPSPEQQMANYQLQERLYGDQGLAIDWLRSLGVEQNLIDQLKTDYRFAERRIVEPAELFQDMSGAMPQLWLELNGTQYSFALIRKGTDTTVLQAAAAEMENVEFIDTVSMATAALKEQRRSSSIVLIAAYFLIAILLVVRYRSINSLTMLAVPLGATLATVLLFQITNQALTVFHTMAMFLVLGLGMDYVIFAAEMKTDKLVTLTAIFLSAITSLLSFGLLSLSSLTVVSAFGLTVLIGNTGNLIGTIIFSHGGARFKTGS